MIATRRLGYHYRLYRPMRRLFRRPRRRTGRRRFPGRRAPLSVQLRRRSRAGDRSCASRSSRTSFDVAHDLGVEPVERLLDPVGAAWLGRQDPQAGDDRLALTADGAPLTIGSWSAPEPLAERQSVRLEGRATLGRAGRRDHGHDRDVPVRPAAPDVHQRLRERTRSTSQAILDKSRTRFEYFAGTRQGTLRRRASGSCRRASITS